MKKKTTNNELTALRNSFDLVDETAQNFIDAVSDKTYKVVASESNSVFSLVDERNNTVCIAYDNIRLQFTTVNAKKYKAILFAKDAKYKDRFYTHLYKQKEFISIKVDSVKDLKEILIYIKSVDKEYRKQQKTTTATKKAVEAVKEA